MMALCLLVIGLVVAPAYAYEGPCDSCFTRKLIQQKGAEVRLAGLPTFVVTPPLPKFGFKKPVPAVILYRFVAPRLGKARS